jgi:lipoprotein-releasing system ATP-binding protein
VLEVDGISKSFSTPSGPLRVLDRVSFSLGDGDRLAVMGPSGSGKSTLLSILGGLEEPTGGSMRLDGVDPFALPPAGRAAFRNRHVGFVFQEHHLLDGLTALDNVVLPALATGRIAAGVEMRARELLARVGLGGRMGHLPAELSGGERQRVAVARALLLSPRLLLADEPTGQLDAATAAGVADLLCELAEEIGGILVVVTHSEAFARRVGAVRQLADGRLLP